MRRRENKRQTDKNVKRVLIPPQLGERQLQMALPPSNGNRLIHALMLSPYEV
jgi:hypothetical protein